VDGVETDDDHRFRVAVVQPSSVKRNFGPEHDEKKGQNKDFWRRKKNEENKKEAQETFWSKLKKKMWEEEERERGKSSTA